MKKTSSPLRRIRLIKEMSQGEVAKKAGISRPDLSKIECGHFAAGPELRRRLANALSLPESVVFGEQEED